MKPYSIQFQETADIEDCRPHSAEPDFCSQEGAAVLKAMIESYWAARGQQVMVALHNVGFHPAIRAARFDIRSDMINGKPRGAVPRQAHRAETEEASHADLAAA